MEAVSKNQNYLCTEPELSGSFSTCGELINALQQHIAWQKTHFGNIDLSRCDHVLARYNGEDRKDKISFSDQHYTRYPIPMPEGVDDFDMYVIGREKNQMSDIHDHADNGCIMKFLQGTLIENRYAKNGDAFSLIKETSYHAGDTAYVPGTIGFHAIGTSIPKRAVSLHVYSPAKFKTSFFGNEGAHEKDVITSVIDSMNTHFDEKASVNFRKATGFDKTFVEELMETELRSYVQDSFSSQKQVETYMKVNSVFDPSKTLILQEVKDGTVTPVGRIVLGLEDFDGYPAIVIEQLQVKKEFLTHSVFKSASFYTRMLKTLLGGNFRKSLRRMDMPVLFQIIKKSPLKSLYSNGFLGLYFQNVTELVGMGGGKREVFGYFPKGTDPSNYSYASKRKVLLEQGIFGDEYATQEFQLDSIDTEYLMDRTVSMIKSYMNSIEKRERKVVNFHQPAELKELFDFSLPKAGVGDEEILQSLQAVLDKSVATMHPRFFNQLYAGANIYSTMAEWITSVLNTSMYTYEVGPLFTLMEEFVYKSLAKQVGREGLVDGMMLPGGSNSNLNAMQMARYAHDPDLHKTGLYDKKKLYVLTSDESHYSITKSAMLMGLGKDAVVKIATNDTGQMDVVALESKIHEIRDAGGEIFMINATAGTTVLGAYDPIRAIAEVGKKYDIWTHVDMIRGGTVMFDEVLKEKIEGIQLVDSFAWNPHKMMGASMQCSVWMTQRPGVTASCNVLKTQYLFANDKGYGVGCDTGDKYSQCGRRVDVLKLRLMRKSLGQDGIAANTRKAFADASYLVDQVNDASQLYLYQEPQCTNVCFWYIPSELTLPGTSHEKNLAYIKEHYHRIHTINAQIKDRMLEKGEAMVNYAHTKGFPNFFRMITISPKVEKSDLDFVVSHIQELGREIE